MLSGRQVDILWFGVVMQILSIPCTSFSAPALVTDVSTFCFHTFERTLVWFIGGCHTTLYHDAAAQCYATSLYHAITP